MGIDGIWAIHVSNGQHFGVINWHVQYLSLKTDRLHSIQPGVHFKTMGNERIFARDLKGCAKYCKWVASVTFKFFCSLPFQLLPSIVF